MLPRISGRLLGRIGVPKFPQELERIRMRNFFRSERTDSSCGRKLRQPENILEWGIRDKCIPDHEFPLVPAPQRNTDMYKWNQRRAY